VTYRIATEGCINCGWCRRACPTATIRFFATGQRLHLIEPEGCIDCAICARVCPVDVISHDPTYTHDSGALAAAKERARGWAGEQRRSRLRRRERAATIAAGLRR
jgi:ferredoxin